MKEWINEWRKHLTEDYRSLVWAWEETHQPGRVTRQYVKHIAYDFRKPESELDEAINYLVTVKDPQKKNWHWRLIESDKIAGGVWVEGSLRYLGLQILSFQKQVVCSPGVEGDNTEAGIRFGQVNRVSQMGRIRVERRGNKKRRLCDMLS